MKAKVERTKIPITEDVYGPVHYWKVIYGGKIIAMIPDYQQALRIAILTGVMNSKVAPNE